MARQIRRKAPEPAGQHIGGAARVQDPEAKSAITELTNALGILERKVNTEMARLAQREQGVEPPRVQVWRLTDVRRIRDGILGVFGRTFTLRDGKKEGDTTEVLVAEISMTNPQTETGGGTSNTYNTTNNTNYYHTVYMTWPD